MRTFWCWAITFYQKTCLLRDRKTETQRLLQTGHGYKTLNKSSMPLDSLMFSQTDINTVLRKVYHRAIQHTCTCNHQILQYNITASLRAFKGRGVLHLRMCMWVYDKGKCTVLKSRILSCSLIT